MQYLDRYFDYFEYSFWRRPWSVSRLWSHRACEEFFLQGDRERELGLPVTPAFDRFNITVAKVGI